LKYCRLCGGVINEGASPKEADIPEEVFPAIQRMNERWKMTEQQMDAFSAEINATTTDEYGNKIRKHPIPRIFRAIEAWNKFNYGPKGKGPFYFLGILKRIGDEAEAQSRTLDGLPPLV
jgi:hypothetical protein